MSEGLLTLGQVAARLGVPSYRILYIVQTRGIKETARAGPWRLWSEEQVTIIRGILAGIDAARGR